MTQETKDTRSQYRAAGENGGVQKGDDRQSVAGVKSNFPSEKDSARGSSGPATRKISGAEKPEDHKS